MTKFNLHETGQYIAQKLQKITHITMIIFVFKKEPSCRSSKWKTLFFECFNSFHCISTCWVGRRIPNDLWNCRAWWPELFDTSHALLHPLITDPDGLIRVKIHIIWIMRPIVWPRSCLFPLSLSHYPLATKWYLTCPPKPTMDRSRLNDKVK